jgi:DNA-binding transcriptional ArsR family regulator
MKKRNANTCIRVNRDENQISRCRQFVQQLEEPTAQLSQRLSLAGNAVRLRILLLLAEEHTLCVCDLAEILQMTVPAISQHLKKLKAAGLVITEQDGVTIYYHLSATAKNLVETLFHLLESRPAATRSTARRRR